MTNCLYYPQYTPSRLHLRSALLFYENLKCIVPQEDQHHVIARDHVAEITKAAQEEEKYDHEKTVSCVFPDEAYFEWWKNPIERSLLRAKISKQSNSNDLKEFLQNLSYKPHPYNFYRYSVVDVDEPGQSTLIKQLRAEGWRLVAAQKMSEEAIEHLRESLVAIPLPHIARTEENRAIEMNPVLMRNDVANFIVARLARHLGARHDCITLGLERDNLEQHLTTNGSESRQVRTAFMRFALPCVIPQEVDKLEISDYWEIRSEYADFRRDLSLLVEGLTKPRELHELNNVKELFAETEHLVNEVFHRIEQQRKILARRKSVSVASYSLGVGTTLLSSLIESNFGTVAGVATIFGTPVIEKVINRHLDTLVADDDSEFVKNTAAMSAEIVTKANRKQRQLPSYLV